MARAMVGGTFFFLQRLPCSQRLLYGRLFVNGALPSNNSSKIAKKRVLVRSAPCVTDARVLV